MYEAGLEGGRLADRAAENDFATGARAATTVIAGALAYPVLSDGATFDECRHADFEWCICTRHKRRDGRMERACGFGRSRQDPTFIDEGDFDQMYDFWDDFRRPNPPMFMLRTAPF